MCPGPQGPEEAGGLDRGCKDGRAGRSRLEAPLWRPTTTGAAGQAEAWKPGPLLDSSALGARTQAAGDSSGI